MLSILNIATSWIEMLNVQKRCGITERTNHMWRTDFDWRFPVADLGVSGVPPGGYLTPWQLEDPPPASHLQSALLRSSGAKLEGAVHAEICGVCDQLWELRSSEKRTNQL